MRSREEEANSGCTLDLNVVMELGAVVGGDGFETLRVPTHEAQGPSIGVLFGSRSELADQDVPGFAFDESHDVSAGRKLHTDGGPILHTSPAAIAVI
jgi:hypothetical protein